MSRTRGQPAALYRRLPHGPSGLGREEVARNQRARIYGAMIESVSQSGYHGTTVAQVIGLAGVSRRAFYEQFPNKEQCFLATYDIVVARSRKRVIDAWQGERGWANRLHASCKALLDEVAESPKGPHLVLVDALGIGPQARERMQIAGFAFERMLAWALQAAPDEIRVQPIATRAIVGGVRQLVFVRLLEGREAELAGLTDEVLDWMEAYRSPAALRLGPVRPRERARRPPIPAAFLCGEGRRARALGSVVHLTLDEGYARLTDPQVAQFAGLSTEGFHRQFASKEACFLAVLDEFVAEALDAARNEMDAAASWPEAVHRAIGAFLDYLLLQQALLRIAFVEVFEVGPAMIGRMTKSVEALTRTLVADGPDPRRGPLVAAEAITGSIWSVIASCVTSDLMPQLAGLVDHLAFLVLAPHIGARAAMETIQASRVSPRVS